MTQEIKQAKQQCRCAEQQWHKTSLEVHCQIYAHCRNVVNREIRNAKKQFLCEKIVSASSSKEPFHLSGHLDDGHIHEHCPARQYFPCKSSQ